MKLCIQCSSNRLMTISSKKNYQTAEIPYTWPLIPSSFLPLKQSHIHLLHDHRIFHHCMTSSLTLNNWGQKYCQTLGYIPKPINSTVWFNSIFNTTNVSKIFITSKTQTTHKAIANGYKYPKNWPGQMITPYQKTELFPVIWYLKCHSSRTHFYTHLTESTKMA